MLSPNYGHSENNGYMYVLYMYVYTIKHCSSFCKYANINVMKINKKKIITCPLIKKKVRQVYGVTPSFISQGFGQVVF